MSTIARNVKSDLDEVLEHLLSEAEKVDDPNKRLLAIRKAALIHSMNTTMIEWIDTPEGCTEWMIAAIRTLVGCFMIVPTKGNSLDTLLEGIRIEWDSLHKRIGDKI